MKYHNLGNTDIKVSEICLGTMTYGEQNTEADAHEQLDYALDHDINFIDTAELYAVPPRESTYTLTEKYIGTWLSKRSDRDKIILATKVSGPRADVPYIRNGPKFNKTHITQALEGSLQRLKTDYVDLYQLHWPDRNANNFGQLGYTHDPNEEWEYNFLDLLELFDGLIKQGKIRYIGLSNETPWGTMEFLRLSEKHNLPRIVSVQNPYNLLNRSYEVGMAEISMRENVGLLAYSPLAFGLLTGKYYHGAQPANSRITMFKQLGRYNGESSKKAADLYTDLARDNDLSPAQLALAYINTRPFLTSNIIGATTMAQLKEDIESVNVNLPAEVIRKIDEIHSIFSNPAP